MNYYSITAQERRDVFELLDPLEEDGVLTSTGSFRCCSALRLVRSPLL